MLKITLLTVALGLLCNYASCQQCQERNGRFASPSQCDAYIECNDGVPEQKLCPDGLLFNPKAKYFSYPCVYPIDAVCEGRSALQPAQATDDCPHQFGYYRLGDERSCGKFMNCASGRGYIMDCPIGLGWNEDTYQCDWPDQVPTCDAEAFLGFRCPQPTEDLFRDEYQFHRHPQNCQQYFICINGRPRLYQCGEGHAFNEVIGGCDGIENVTGCASQFPSNNERRPVQLSRGR